MKPQSPSWLRRDPVKWGTSAGCELVPRTRTATRVGDASVRGLLAGAMDPKILRDSSLCASMSPRADGAVCRPPVSAPWWRAESGA